MTVDFQIVYIHTYIYSYPHYCTWVCKYKYVYVYICTMREYNHFNVWQQPICLTVLITITHTKCRSHTSIQRTAALIWCLEKLHNKAAESGLLRLSVGWLLLYCRYDKLFVVTFVVDAMHLKMPESASWRLIFWSNKIYENVCVLVIHISVPECLSTHGRYNTCIHTYVC